MEYAPPIPYHVISETSLFGLNILFGRYTLDKHYSRNAKRIITCSTMLGDIFGAKIVA